MGGLKYGAVKEEGIWGRQEVEGEGEGEGEDLRHGEA
jgi:hypothetical protein